jgi:hypothetical protein
VTFNERHHQCSGFTHRVVVHDQGRHHPFRIQFQIRRVVLLFSFRNHKHTVGKSWRKDETYIKVKGVWKYLYRAVDKQGKAVDFLLTAKRDALAARRFFDKATWHSEVLTR